MNTSDELRADAHIHLFEHGYHHREPPGSELAQYERIRSVAGIDLAVVVGYEGQNAFAGNNDYILRAAACHRWIAPLAYLRVAPPPSAAAIRHLSRRGFAGFSLYVPETGPNLHDWPFDALTALADGGLLSVNCTLAGLRQVTSKLVQLDGVPILISHLGGPPANLAHASASAVAEAVAPVIQVCRQRNVHVKLSGLYAIDQGFPHAGATAIVRALLDAVGPAKMVWGSDFSPALDAVTERQLVEIPGWLEPLLSADERTGLLGRNLRGLLTRNEPTVVYGGCV